MNKIIALLFIFPAMGLAQTKWLSPINGNNQTLSNAIIADSTLSAQTLTNSGIASITSAGLLGSNNTWTGTNTFGSVIASLFTGTLSTQTLTNSGIPTITNAVMISSNQTITGNKTFSGTVSLPNSAKEYVLFNGQKFNTIVAGDSYMVTSSLGVALAAQSKFATSTVSNIAIGGTSLENWISSYTTSIHIYAPSVTGTPALLIFDVGQNYTSSSSADFLTKLNGFYDTAKTDGFIMVGTTVFPFGTLANDLPLMNLINDGIRSSSHWDYLFDLQSIFGTSWGSLESSTVGGHPSTFAGLIMANIINNRVLTSTPPGIVNGFFAKGLGFARNDPFQTYNSTYTTSSAYQLNYVDTNINTSSTAINPGLVIFNLATVASNSVGLGPRLSFAGYVPTRGPIPWVAGSINCEIAGNTTSADGSGRLVFSTSRHTGFSDHGIKEAARITENGNLLVGTSTESSTFDSGPRVQINGDLLMRTDSNPVGSILVGCNKPSTQTAQAGQPNGMFAVGPTGFLGDGTSAYVTSNAGYKFDWGTFFCETTTQAYVIFQVHKTSGFLFKTSTATSGVPIQSTIGAIDLSGNATFSGTQTANYFKSNTSGTATLSSGTVTITNSSIVSTSKLFLSRSSANSSTTLGVALIPVVGTGTASITAVRSNGSTTEAGDTSVVNWEAR